MPDMHLRFNIYTDPRTPVQVKPGIYKVGNPGPESPVFLTTNAVITKKADWIEPFNAFYSKKLIPAIEDNIKKGKVRTMELLEISNVLYIDEAIARGFSPDWSMFANLNTREDLKGLV